MPPSQMMQNAQGGMIHPQGTVRSSNQMMSMIKPGTTAPTVMGPGGHQMMANGRSAGWQGQPGVRPTIQFQQQQPGNAMYGPPGVQQRRFENNTIFAKKIATFHPTAPFHSCNFLNVIPQREPKSFISVTFDLFQKDICYLN